jgi:hypothetical protein
VIVYLSGPITGMPENNRRVFREVEKQIRKIAPREIAVYNPIKLSKIVDRRFAGTDRKPAWEDYMRFDIAKLVKADCAYFLKGWELSKGASLERYIAVRLGIPCVESIDELELFYEEIPMIREGENIYRKLQEGA